MYQRRIEPESNDNDISIIDQCFFFFVNYIKPKTIKRAFSRVKFGKY